MFMILCNTDIMMPFWFDGCGMINDLKVKDFLKLSARSWNAEAAEKMLRQSMKWRLQWEVETTLKDWSPPEAIRLFYPSGVCGYDKDGAPIIIVPFAGLDIVGLLHSVSKQDLIRSTIQILERVLKLAAETGANNVLVLFDMDGFSLRQYAWRPAAEFVIALLQMYEANYPEILKCCYILNVPKVFNIAFNVVKKFLNENTLSKIQIFKKDPKKWKAAILTNVAPNQLPKYFGGELEDPDGNPHYATKINQGGKVPKFYYTTKLDEKSLTNNKEYVTAVIKKGEKISLDFVIEEEGCFLRWEFRTEDHDIRFGITLKDAEGNTSPAVRHSRVSSHQIDENGVLACQAPAIYTVTFDNSYSLLRNKRVHYCIYVAPPISKLNILPSDVDSNLSAQNCEEQPTTSGA